MSEQFQEHLDILDFLQRTNNKNRKHLLSLADKDLVFCICECIINVLNGNVPLTSEQMKALKRHKTVLRELSEKRRKAINRKRQLLVQKGNGFLPILLGPVLAAAGSLISEFIQNNR